MRTETRASIAGPLLLALAGCAAPDPGHAAQPAERRPKPSQHEAIEATLGALYASFCFDAGGPADWSRMRSLLLEGSSFVAPGSARGVGSTEFLEDFETWIATGPEGRTGLHERIVNTRIDSFGQIAHAWVTFEGFVPGEPADRRGLDSIQLVKQGDRWLVASFTTQYATAAAPMPARFEARAGR